MQHSPSSAGDEVHGTADQTILYNGNSVPPRTYSDPPVTTSVPAGAQVWRQINQCDALTPGPTNVTADGITYDGTPAFGEPGEITQIKGIHCANGVHTGSITVHDQPHVVLDALQADRFDIAECFWKTVFGKR